MPYDNLLKFKVGWLIREGLYPSNKSHELPKVGLIPMTLGCFGWTYVIWENYMFAKLITRFECLVHLLMHGMFCLLHDLYLITLSPWLSLIIHWINLIMLIRKETWT